MKLLPLQSWIRHVSGGIVSNTDWRKFHGANVCCWLPAAPTIVDVSVVFNTQHYLDRVSAGV